ncbi:MAG: hypothetical protein FWB78_00410 [Treponema sp.]|nr:hypothetical protein [Treponema sp.]
MFEVGHLLTLGIAIILIIFFRLLDKSNRSLDKVRKHVDRYKKEISDYIDDKSSVIQDYGIALEVEKKAAAELMRRIQKLTREELAQKVQALTQIDDRIQGYDASLTELIQMTGRVQENLNRIRDESSFVEGVAKRLGEIKEKVENAEAEVGTVSGELGAIGERFESENTAALEKAAEMVVTKTRSAIQGLEARLTREEERIVELFTEAVNKAGGRADKVEETALAKLRGQAEERLGRIKTSFEERLKSLQDFVKTNRDEMQEQIRLNKEEWKTETDTMNAQKEAFGADARNFRAEWDKNAGELASLIRQQAEESLESARDFFDTNLDGIRERISREKEEWRVETDELDTQKKAYAANMSKLREEWDRQAGELSALLKRQTQEAEESIREQDEELRREIVKHRDEWGKQAEELSAFLKQQTQETNESIREQDEELRREIVKHRDEWKALYHDTGLDIATAVEDRLEEYRLTQEERLSQLASLSDDSAQLESELRIAMKEASDRVKEDFVRVSKDMRDTWESGSQDLKRDIQALQEELAEVERGLSGIKDTASENISSKLKVFEEEFTGELSKRGTEAIQQIEAWQDDLNSRLEAITTDAETRRRKAEIKITDEMKNDFATLSEKLMSDLESMKTRATAFEEKTTLEIREANETRRVLYEQLESNLTKAKSTMEEVRRESTTMSKAFERSGALKKELDLHDDKLKDNADRLSQLNDDIAKFESQYSQMKHLEDDINARITRFTAEKRRIEGMESDFNSLLRTAKQVEEKLTQVSNTDDTLQTVQVKIRQLDEVIKEAEEKFQRVERKTQTLQETNDGIDRNFRALQENEQLLNRLDGIIGLLKTDVDGIQSSVDALSAENERTREASEKLTTLDESIRWLEGRIAEMNQAREMATRLATELQELGKIAKDQVKMAQSVYQRPSSSRPTASDDSGAPAPRDRDNVIILKRQGWSIDEIARSMNMSKGAVELILELSPKDT